MWEKSVGFSRSSGKNMEIYEQSHSLYRLYSLYSLYSRIFAIGVIWSKNPFFDSIFFFLAIDRPLLVASYVL
jgi:hypothetical protein